jgi:DNA polymerase elongation subunit (family B)
LDKPRILLYDIETSLQPVAVFQLAGNDWIDPSSILAERHLISVCWKWYGNAKVHSVSLLDDPKRFAADPHDDRHVAEVFHKVLQEADVLVGHNSDSFDLRYLKTRMLVHGLPALAPMSTLDTYKVAKKHFMLNSNKLDYIARLLKIGKKMDTPKGLWMDVLRGSRKAVSTMVKYNRHDVILLEKVFSRLRPYMDNHINRELFSKEGCPRCGSSKIQSRGYHRAISRVYRRFQCQNPVCMGWFRAAVNEKDIKTKFRVL